MSLTTSILRVLEKNKITLDDFCFNFLLRTVRRDETVENTNEVRECLDELPDSLVEHLYDYAHSYLSECDFMPCPKSFMVGPFTEGAMEAKKRLMRPCYLSLLDLIRKRRDQVLANRTTTQQ